MTTGELRLKVENIKGRMVCTESFVSGAFKLGKPIWYDKTPLYYLLHVGGGYVSGDSYSQQIELLDYTKLFLTTQAATKVYKGERPAVVDTVIHIGEQSHLSLLQDPLILYKDAMFHQQTTVHLKSSSSFYFSEIITPGWSPTQDVFQYKEYFSDLKIFKDQQLYYVDRLFWQQQVQQQLLHLGSYTHYGTYLCMDTVDDLLLEQIYSFENKVLEIGVSKLPDHGFVLKVAGNDTQTIEVLFQKVDNLLRVKNKEQQLQLRKY